MPEEERFRIHRGGGGRVILSGGARRRGDASARDARGRARQRRATRARRAPRRMTRAPRAKSDETRPGRRAAAANAPHDDARIETMRMPAARTDDTRGGWTGARRRASPKCGAPQKRHRPSPHPTRMTDRPPPHACASHAGVQHAFGWIATRFARSKNNIFATSDLVGPILVVNTGILRIKKILLTGISLEFLFPARFCRSESHV